jgi:hypothetical protein
MPTPDDKSLVDNITVTAGGKVVVIGSVSGNVFIHLRDGETELMHKARIELVNYASALFVDIMRLYCVAGSAAERSANSARYQEFVDVADQHVDDFKTHLTLCARSPRAERPKHQHAESEAVASTTISRVLAVHGRS